MLFVLENYESSDEPIHFEWSFHVSYMRANDTLRPISSEKTAESLRFSLAPFLLRCSKAIVEVWIVQAHAHQDGDHR